MENNSLYLLPKIELHAHLNGSLSTSTLRKLGCDQDDIAEYSRLTQQLSSHEKRLQECFSVFQIAHNATRDVQSVYQATKNVIEEFHKDNVIYLELRTTPRNENNMTKAQYIESVIKGIKDSNKKIITKLLLSIDRGHDSKVSEDAMDLIINMKNKYPDIIKGVDLCGNPSVGSFNSALFRLAVKNDLCVTLHCAEIKNSDEVKKILQFGPQRIGHGTYIHTNYGGTEECWELYNIKNIPLECCLTSNVLCGTVKDYSEHHVKQWISNSLPFSLCTDDKGVFDTSLSRELAVAAEHYNLTLEDLWQINYNAVDYSFASDSEKLVLKELLQDWKLKQT